MRLQSQTALFHGVGPFDLKSGHVLQAPAPTYTRVFSEALVELAEADERIVAITAAMPEGTGLNRFAASFPAGSMMWIAEQNAVTMAGAMALQGLLRPVVAIYSTFTALL